MKARVINAAVVGMLLACGCAQMVPRGGRQWKACGVGAGVGALGGAALGAGIGAAVAGERGAKIGALVGAATGLLSGCAIATTLTARDEAELANAERRALQSGEPQSAEWTNEQGEQRKYEVAIEPAESTKGQTCRRTRGQLTDVNSGKFGITERVYCRNSAGDWVPA
ncbi:MAG: hypothetical protein KatS3mg015_2612 [Fimbriimonadales bacterium]|nr:MAG: hypothetical protein KatS3mg015_2612 [Fimbriimonadales bacterium]